MKYFICFIAAIIMTLLCGCYAGSRSYVRPDDNFYEQPRKKVLRMNVITGQWSYQFPDAQLIMNPITGKWEWDR